MPHWCQFFGSPVIGQIEPVRCCDRGVASPSAIGRVSGPDRPPPKVSGPDRPPPKVWLWNVNDHCTPSIGGWLICGIAEWQCTGPEHPPIRFTLKRLNSFVPFRLLFTFHRLDIENSTKTKSVCATFIAGAALIINFQFLPKSVQS